MADWKLTGATRHTQSVDSEWAPVGQELLSGVSVREIQNVVRDTRVLTEIWRGDWRLDDGRVDQVFQVVLRPGAISAWHAHESTTDRLFVASGQVRLVLYDPRPDSETHGRVNELHLSVLRPKLVVVPPRLWHGVANEGSEPALLLNLTDRAYDYVEPDHWQLPSDTREIPYSFSTRAPGGAAS